MDVSRRVASAARVAGLRYAELASPTPVSFDLENGPCVTVAAAYTKNGQTARLPLPDDLAEELAAFLAPLALGASVFPLPAEEGAKMLRIDLAAAGIPYRDAAGLVFDFHPRLRDHASQVFRLRTVARGDVPPRASRAPRGTAGSRCLARARPTRTG